MRTLDRNPENVIVVGAGGFAAEIVNHLRDIATHRATISGAPPLNILGVVDNFAGAAAPTHVCGAPFLGSEDAAAGVDCAYAIATGTPRFRQEAVARLRARKRRLFTLIHPSACISPDASIGEGTVIAQFACVQARSQVGIACVANVYCNVGHDARLGDYSVLSPYAALGGGSSAGDMCFFATRATLFPRISVGARCTIDAHSAARHDAPDRMIITARGDYRVFPNRLEPLS